MNSDEWIEILGRLPEQNEKLALNFIVMSAARFSFIESLVLFGSRARGDHKLRSDFDIAVGVNSSVTQQDWNSFCSVVNEDFPTLHSVDLIRFDALNSQLLQAVQREGKQIYHGVAEKLIT